MDFNLYTIYSIILVCLFACQEPPYPYPRNRNIADENGKSIDSLTPYFSTFQPFDSSQLELTNRRFWNDYFSENLRAFNEPILFNDYQGKDMYRFLLLRSFDPPLVFTIINDNGKIALTTKKLDRAPGTDEVRYFGVSKLDSSFWRDGYQIFMEMDTLHGRPEMALVVRANEKVKLIYNSTKSFSRKEWHQFNKLLNEADFWRLKPFYWAGDADGAAWVIEGHTKNQYKYVIRQSPKGRLEEVGKFLVELSGLNERIY